ncbi:MAG: hypothetical protein ACT4N4_14315, partial [Rhodospirillales bacterium]
MPPDSPRFRRASRQFRSKPALNAKDRSPEQVMERQMDTNGLIGRRLPVGFSRTPRRRSRIEKGKDDAAEFVRMTGCFKPLHFDSMFEYVIEKAHGNRIFSGFHEGRGQKLRARGKDA